MTARLSNQPVTLLCKTPGCPHERRLMGLCLWHHRGEEPPEHRTPALAQVLDAPVETRPVERESDGGNQPPRRTGRLVGKMRYIPDVPEATPSEPAPTDYRARIVSEQQALATEYGALNLERQQIRARLADIDIKLMHILDRQDLLDRLLAPTPGA